MTKLDWFLKKSGTVFNLVEAKPNDSILGKDKELAPLYSINKLLCERPRFERFLNC